MRNFLLLCLLASCSFANAQDDCLYQADIAITTSSWGDEVSWSLLDANGQVVASGSNYASNESYVSAACLNDPCYTLELSDSFGDGWNGASISVNYPDLGIMVGPMTIVQGSYAAFSVGIDSTCNGQEVDGNENGGGNEDTWGCMDPSALNFDSIANLDCCCQYPLNCDDSNTLTIVQGTATDSILGGFTSAQFTIVGSDGFTWYPSFNGINDQGQWVLEGCIADGCYNLTVYNSSLFGDVNLDVLLNGDWLESFTVTADMAVLTEGLGINQDSCGFSLFGCTDPEAPNFNPEADTDDGSCLEPCDCPSEFDPVCGFNFTTGQYLTFNNLCELECAGAYFAWEGDCSEQPQYGCMDAEALNYDPDATADSGWCVYMPDCDGSTFVTLTSSTANVDSIFGNISDVALTGIFQGSDGTYSNFASYNDGNGYSVSLGCLEDGCYNFFIYSNNWASGGSIEVAVDGVDPETFTLGADEYSLLVPVGINETGCEVFIPGCTDSEALNYNADATEDDGSCQYPFTCPDDQIPAQLYVCTFSQGNQVSLNIVDSQGEVIYSQDGYLDMTIDYIDICLNPEECYTATMSNNAGGDSWNGGYFWVQGNNSEWVNGSLEGATTDSIEFGMADGCGGDVGGEVYGCTDPAALNFTPLATVNDGSCLYDTVDSLDCGGDNLVSGIFFASDPWFSEVSWAILDSLGNSVFIGNGGNGNDGGFTQTCLPDGCYTVELYDSFGDGWGGSLLVLTTETAALTFTLEQGDFASYPYEVGTGCGEEPVTIWGCMDPDAMNFNASATAEDESCEYENDGVDNPGMSGWDTPVDFSVYPTPSGEIVNILGEGFGNESPVVVRIKDMMGKLIVERTVFPIEGPAGWRFDVRNWPAGIYTAEGTQGKKVATGKVLVAR